MNDILVQKIQSIQRCVQRARSIYAASGERFLIDDYDAQDASMLNIIRACEQAIDRLYCILKLYSIPIFTQLSS